MKRLLFFALVVFAAWYGWHHYNELRQAGSHDLLIVNRSGHAIERLRIVALDQTEVVESLENGVDTKRSLRALKDGTFEVYWSYRGVLGDHQWRGGSFTHGPLLMRYRFEFRGGDDMIWSSERKSEKAD